jgi:hypothetical protein
VTPGPQPPLVGVWPDVHSTPSDAQPDWEFVHAPRGGGRWLCTRTSAGPIALAAPGVALDPGSDEPLDCWRRGRWRPSADDCEEIDVRRPHCVEAMRLVEVADLVGSEWQPWLRTVTVVLVDRAYAFGFVGSHGAPLRELRAARTQLVFDRLVEEAREVFADLDVPSARKEMRSPRRMPATVRKLERMAQRRPLVCRVWSMWRRLVLRLLADRRRCVTPPADGQLPL